MASRWKKEEARKKAEARRGLSSEEIKALDEKDAAKKKLESETRGFHAALFSEEYDFMSDSTLDEDDRDAGRNPMKSSYQEEVNQRRVEMGFMPLTADGKAPDHKTYEFVRTALADGKREVQIGLLEKYGLFDYLMDENGAPLIL